MLRRIKPTLKEHETQCRQEIAVWLLVANRLEVPRDITKLIAGKYLWRKHPRSVTFQQAFTMITQSQNRRWVLGFLDKESCYSMDRTLVRHFESDAVGVYSRYGTRNMRPVEIRISSEGYTMLDWFEEVTGRKLDITLNHNPYRYYPEDAYFVY